MNDETYGLALSGGGFRATFFHLGVIEALKKVGHLKNVRHITGISGGAIAAAHLWLYWDQYLSGNEREFEGLVDELMRFALGGLQKRILQRKFWRSIFGQGTRTSDWLIDEYQPLFRGATLGTRRRFRAKACPRLSILATSLNTGLPVALDSTGIFAVRGGEPDIGMPRLTDTKRSIDQIPWNPNVTLAQAVAASSAHPALFSPVHLGSPHLNDLIDGGIHDNLGIVWMDELCPPNPDYDFSKLLVSDAGARRNYRPENEMQHSTDYEKYVQRNLAAVDLIMRHLDETRHQRWQRPREYFHICTQGNAPWSREHPAMLPTTFNNLGEVNLEALRNHGRFVVADRFSTGVQ